MILKKMYPSLFDNASYMFFAQFKPFYLQIDGDTRAYSILLFRALMISLITGFSLWSSQDIISFQSESDLHQARIPFLKLDLFFFFAWSFSSEIIFFVNFKIKICAVEIIDRCINTIHFICTLGKYFNDMFIFVAKPS